MTKCGIIVVISLSFILSSVSDQLMLLRGTFDAEEEFGLSDELFSRGSRNHEEQVILCVSV